MSSSPWYTASVFVSPQMSQVLGKQSTFYCIWVWIAAFIPQSYANKSLYAVTFHLDNMTNTLVCDYLFVLNKGVEEDFCRIVSVRTISLGDCRVSAFFRILFYR